MIRAGFESGVAGTFVFSWTDDWFAGGAQIADWAFCLVDAHRQAKPAYRAVQAQYAAPLPPRLERTPRVSVVVCAYNAERTMDACLESLRTLNYPDYEVIVVNDGSKDRTLEISERHKAVYDADPGGPRMVIISQENKGLSVARNVGAQAATGEIVAYTDSDCVPDPDWLAFLVYKFVRSGFVAVGGPNFPPPEPYLVPAAVAASPGGPTHVLLNDEVAARIPGCNMAFTKKALEEIGGFEPVFAAAGDDVDLCWRLQNRGYPIGFSPAATVWHYRRNTVKAYLKQQMGYGKAEALLYFKHPYRFNLLGQSRWLGRIYGELTTAVLSRRPIIYFDAFGRGLQRYLWRLRAHGDVEPVEFEGQQQPARIDWLARAFTLGYWSEQGHEKEALLAGVMEFLIPRKYLIAVDPGWNRWDLEIYRGIWSKLRLTVAAENHGGSKRLLNVRCEVRLTRVSELALAGYLVAVVCGLVFYLPEITGVGAALGIVNLGVIVTENIRLGRTLNDTLDIVAGRIALRPLGSGAAPAKAQAA